MFGFSVLARLTVARTAWPFIVKVMQAGNIGGLNLAVLAKLMDIWSFLLRESVKAHIMDTWDVFSWPKWPWQSYKQVCFDETAL